MSAKIMADAQELAEYDGSRQLQSLTNLFFIDRLKNATQIEAIKQQAIAQLKLRLLDPNEQLTVAKLLGIIELLGNQSYNDFDAIISAVTVKSKSPTSADGVNPFFSAPAPNSPVTTPSDGMTAEAYRVIDTLVSISERVVKHPKSDDDSGTTS